MAKIDTMKPYIHKVHYYETDKMGITHHSNYIRWMEEARVEYLEQLCWGYKKIEDLGIISPVLSIDISFKHTTTFDDTISICARVKDFTGVKLTIEYEMKNEKTGELVCTGTSLHCFLDKDMHPLHLKKECEGLYDALLKEKGEA